MSRGPPFPRHTPYQPAIHTAISHVTSSPPPLGYVTCDVAAPKQRLFVCSSSLLARISGIPACKSPFFPPHSTSCPSPHLQQPIRYVTCDGAGAGGQAPRSACLCANLPASTPPPTLSPSSPHLTTLFPSSPSPPRYVTCDVAAPKERMFVCKSVKVDEGPYAKTAKGRVRANLLFAMRMKEVEGRPGTCHLQVWAGGPRVFGSGV